MRRIPDHAYLAPLLRALTGAGLLALVGAPACAPAPKPPVCAGAGVCGAGYCVAGRCRPKDERIAPGDGQRVLLQPQDIAVLSARGVTPAPEPVASSSSSDAGSGSGGHARLPEAISLGAASAGSTVLLFRFAATWHDDADVQSAFLVLDPVAGAPPAAAAVTLEVARILDPWRSETATWGRQPRLSIPVVAAVARRAPAGPLRVDVTELVRAWAERARDDHGIALLAPGADPVGVACSMGISEGLGPRLEVYLK